MQEGQHPNALNPDEIAERILRDSRGIELEYGWAVRVDGGGLLRRAEAPLVGRGHPTNRRKRKRPVWSPAVVVRTEHDGYIAEWPSRHVSRSGAESE